MGIKVVDVHHTLIEQFAFFSSRKERESSVGSGRCMRSKMEILLTASIGKKRLSVAECSHDIMMDVIIIEGY